MKMAVTYEWAVECQDEHGDIQDVRSFDSFREAMAERAAADWPKVEIALVRSVGNNVVGMTERHYAYLRDDGTLEPVFSSYHEEGRGACDGPAVPKRFVQHLA
jgi:hypothetical protein